MNRTLRDLLFIVLGCVLLFFWGALSRPLLESSEGRVARVAQEMYESGRVERWIVPTLNGVVRLEKPPFSSWLVAGVAGVTGAHQVESWHAHIPPALGALALVLLVYFWSRRGARGGDAPDAPRGQALFPALAALVLATAPGFLLQARSAEIDMTLALLVGVWVWGVWRHRVDGSRAALMLAYAAAALTVYTKGHVGAVIVLPALFIWLLWERSRLALPPRPAGWLWHGLGLLLILALVLPWAIPYLKLSGITWADFHKEGIDRFGKATGHQEPFWWYFAHIPGWFMPWTLLLPAVIFTRDLPPDERSPLRRLCVCWFFWGLVFFSVLSAKQRHYAVPFFAPLAILIADAWARWLDHPRKAARRLALPALVTVAVLLAIGTGALPVVARQMRMLPCDHAMAAAGVAGVGAAVFLIAALKREARCLSLFWAGAVAAVVAYSLSFETQEGRRDSAEPFCRKVRAFVGDAPLYDFGVALPSRKKVWKAEVLFYLRRRVIVDDSRPPHELLNAGPGPVFALATEAVVTTLRKEHPDSFVEVLSQPNFIGKDWRVYLIRGTNVKSAERQ